MQNSNKMVYIDNPYKNIDQNRLIKLTDFIISYFSLSNKEISISFVNDRQMRELNKKYRNIDRTTDVLSFALSEGEDNFDDTMLGDIIISYDTAQKQAESLNHPLFIENDNLLCHSMLHLLGYDHIEISDRKIMFEQHRKILNEFYRLTEDSEYINDEWLMGENTDG